MKTKTQMDSVAEFNETLRKTALQNGIDMPERSWDLHMALMEEELEELDDAVCLNEGKAAMLKEACDLVYVVLGAVEHLGLSHVFDAAFNRVHENNMRKIRTGSFNKSGKLVKAANHPKVDLSDLVENT